MTKFETRALLTQLEATVGENLDRHLASAEDWMSDRTLPLPPSGSPVRTDGEPPPSTTGPEADDEEDPPS